jgi:hypothetical protein
MASIKGDAWANLLGPGKMDNAGGEGHRGNRLGEKSSVRGYDTEPWPREASPTEFSLVALLGLAVAKVKRTRLPMFLNREMGTAEIVTG